LIVLLNVWITNLDRILQCEWAVLINWKKVEVPMGVKQIVELFQPIGWLYELKGSQFGFSFFMRVMLELFPWKREVNFSVGLEF